MNFEKLIELLANNVLILLAIIIVLVVVILIYWLNAILCSIEEKKNAKKIHLPKEMTRLIKEVGGIKTISLADSIKKLLELGFLAMYLDHMNQGGIVLDKGGKLTLSDAKLQYRLIKRFGELFD